MRSDSRPRLFARGGVRAEIGKEGRDGADEFVARGRETEFDS